MALNRTERSSRPALRPLMDSDTPLTGLSRGTALELNTVENDPAKRPRLALLTPMSGATPSQMYSTPTTNQNARLQAAAAAPLANANGDILDYLKGRGGRIKELEDEVSKSKSIQDQLNSELYRSREQIMRLESELKLAKAAAATVSRADVSAMASRASIGLAEVVEVEKLLDKEIARSLNLEQQLATAKEMQAKAEQRTATMESAMVELRADFEKQKRSLQLQVDALSDQLAISKTETTERVNHAEMALKLEKRMREREQELYQSLQRQVQDMHSQLSAKDDSVQQLKSQLAHAQAALATRAPAPDPAHPSIQQLLEQLRSKDAEIASLQRQQRSLGGAAPLVGDENAPAAASSQLLLAQLQAQHQQWEDSLRKVYPDAQSGEEAMGKLLSQAGQLQELASVMCDRDELVGKLDSLSKSYQRQLEQLQQQVDSGAKELQRALTSEQLLQRKLSVLMQERDSLKRALTAPISLSTPGTVREQLQATQLAAQMAELERRNGELQQLVQQLQEEVAAVTTAKGQQDQVAVTASRRAEAAEQKVQQLEKEADSLARDVATLQERLGRGDVNRSSVRVLHLKMNPETEHHRQARDSDISALKAENEILKRHIEQLEQEVAAARVGAGGAAGGADTAAASSKALAVKEAEVAVLRHKASEMDKAMVRLKEVFKERVAAFREACYCLFGYRVDMTSEATAAKDAASAPTTFSLKPQHADDPNALLVFRYTKARGMELVPTAFSAKLSREVDTFVRKFNSIPALTANLTMENFQKQTVC